MWRSHTSLGEAVIIGEANIICRRQTSFKKRTFVGRQKCVFCWWGKLDSDQRSQWQQIYSLPPLAAREIPHIRSRFAKPMELVNGVEPSTCWLQISCSAIEPHQHVCSPFFATARVIIAQQNRFVNRFLQKILKEKNIFFAKAIDKPLPFCYNCECS